MINLYFSNNTKGGPVFVSCDHKSDKLIFSYLIKIIKELNLKRPEMLLKKEKGKWKLKICSISQKDVILLKCELGLKTYKFNGTELVFNFEV